MKKILLAKKIILGLFLGTMYHAPIACAADDTIGAINITTANTSSSVYGYKVNNGISTIDITNGRITANVNNTSLTGAAYTSAGVVGFYNSYPVTLQGSTGEVFPITVSATGGDASGSGYSNAYGSAYAMHGYNSTTSLNADTTLTATAAGGTVSAPHASAGTLAYGINSENSTTILGGNTTITAIAKSNTSTSTAASGFADAQANAMGIRYSGTSPNLTTIGGNMTIGVTSYGGKASSYSDGYANTYAYGIYYYGTGVNSTISSGNATITGAANGGTAFSSSANADAHADAQGIAAIDNGAANSTSIGGDTTISMAANGGYASSPVFANANARVYGISGSNSTTSLSGNIGVTLTANGGTAISASYADAHASADGIQADVSKTTISGNAEFTVTANGGTTSSSSYAIADARACGISTSNSTTTVGGNTTIKAAATGRNASSSAANATGIDSRNNSNVILYGNTTITTAATSGDNSSYSPANAIGISAENSTVTLNGNTAITATAAATGNDLSSNALASGITARGNSVVTLNSSAKITAAASIKSSNAPAAAYSLFADNSSITINPTANSLYTVKLTGDVIAQNGAAINLSLANSDSFLSGKILANSATVNLAVANGATWTASKPSFLTNLTMNNGRAVLASNLYIAGNLSGTGGTFYLDNGTAECIVVNGTASGSYQLVINNTTKIPAGITLAKIVDLNDSLANTATFTTAQNAFESRAYRYQFAQGSAISSYSGIDSNDYYYYASGPSALASAAIANSADTVVAWYGEMNEIKKRLGDLRMDTQSNSDVWARTYASKYHVKPTGGNSYSQIMRGVEIGRDNPQNYSGGKKYIGFLLGLGQADNTYLGGSNGTTNSRYLGSYASWLKDDGTYLDVIGKYNWLRHDFSTLNFSDASTDSALFHNRALGISAEIGKHITKANGIFIEPQLELSSLWSNSASYTTSQGLVIDVPSVHSLQLRLGCAAGRKWTDRDGANRQFYGKVSWVNEYRGNSCTLVDGAAFDSSLEGHQWITGLGLIEDAEHYQFYLDLEKSWGSTTSKQWGVNMGYRWKL